MRRLSLCLFAAVLAFQLIPLGLAQQASVTTVPNLIRYGGSTEGRARRAAGFLDGGRDLRYLWAAVG